MVRIYYVLRSLAHRDESLQEFECAHDRWADVRNALEKHLIPEKTPHVDRSRVNERQSFFGCVVHNRLCFSTAATTAVGATPGVGTFNPIGAVAAAPTMPMNGAEWRDKSLRLPPLENGSVLLDGDIVLLARAPARALLYLQDTLHRFWLVSLLQQYFAKHCNDSRVQSSAAAFARARATYNLRLFVARLLATADAKALAGVGMRCDLRRAFHNALDKCESDTQCTFEIDRTYVPPFGSTLMPGVLAALDGVCIDVNRRTKLFTRIVQESGGSLESGEALARRLGVEPLLAWLVRDVVHAYQPQHCSSSVVSVSQLPPSLANAAESLAHLDATLSPPPTKRARMATTTDSDDTAMRDSQPVKLESTEDERLDAVLDGDANRGNDNGSGENVVYNTQLYCVTCDVPGHHTCDCPRREFMERLRYLCRTPWEVFYAPENGICPLANSSLATFAARHFASKAGIINRRMPQPRRNVAAAPTAFQLPSVTQHRELRWIAD